MRTVLGIVPRMRRAAVVGLLGLVLTGSVASCADDRAQIDVVVTTTILGDVVRNLVGDEVTVEVVMPRNVDPHDFSPSARQVATLRDAALVVANGLQFESGLEDALDAARDDGVPVFVATSAIETRDRDPHFFTDPVLMSEVVDALTPFLAEHLEQGSREELERRSTSYRRTLRELDVEIRRTVGRLPADERVLVTNHEVFGYFAARYGFRVVGTVVPGTTTLAEPSAGALARLADTVRRTGVRAVFAESSSPATLAETLASEVGRSVEVVELFTESLGDPGSGGETYVDMLRTDARRITEALLR